ncbi:MAG: hypothetical protein J5804_00960 [Eggerthellaceae bacterium]|nr:hypothetical protein [Eggerthellaceae bacterium]
MMSFSCQNQRSLDETVVVEHIRVEQDRVVFQVRIRNQAWHRTTPALATRALQARPNLARHACVNTVGRTFGDVIDDTPLPHLLEHVAIDMLAESCPETHATHVGTSVWLDEPAGLARVQISMQDDLVALAAFKQAVALVNQLLIS